MFTLCAFSLYYRSVHLALFISWLSWYDQTTQELLLIFIWNKIKLVKFKALTLYESILFLISQPYSALQLCLTADWCILPPLSLPELGCLEGWLCFEESAYMKILQEEEQEWPHLRNKKVPSVHLFGNILNPVKSQKHKMCYLLMSAPFRPNLSNQHVNTWDMCVYTQWWTEWNTTDCIYIDKNLLINSISNWREFSQRLHLKRYFI